MSSVEPLCCYFDLAPIVCPYARDLKTEFPAWRVAFIVETRYEVLSLLR